MGICTCPGRFENSSFHPQLRIVLSLSRLPYTPSLDHHLPVFPPAVPDPDSNNYKVEINTVRMMILSRIVQNSPANEGRSASPIEGLTFFESCFLRGEFQPQDFKTHEESDRHQDSGGEHWQSRCALK